MEPTKRRISARDYHYPCNRVAERYRRGMLHHADAENDGNGIRAGTNAGRMRQSGRLSAAMHPSDRTGSFPSGQERLGEAQSVAQKCELAQDENRLIRIANKIRPDFVRRIHPQPQEKPRDAQSALTFFHSIMPPIAMADSVRQS